MDILISIAAKVSEYTVAPIGRQLGYLFFYRRNVEDLNTQIVDLGHVKDRLQHKVEEAQNNARGIEADVSDWLAKADKVITEDHGNFKRDEEQAYTKCICGAKFPNLVLRHRLSRRAKKMAETVATQILEGKNINEVSYRLNLPISIGNKGYEEFESRNRTLTHVMEALRDPNVGMVGVWGMGGVGKTMLAKEVARRAKDDKEKLFTEVVFTTISNDPNIEKIQQDIGEKLRMRFEGESKDVRADQLQKRLRVQENKILIIVDDIWDKLDLEDVGISFGEDQKGCKILFTTRYYRVLASDMSVDRNVIFKVGVLSEHEAMTLFRKIVGDQADKQELQGLASEIVKECGGLPIAITTIASALKVEPYGGWKNALQELRKSNPINIDGVQEKVYPSIKLSYDYLKSGEAKHLLLLCSLFPEDAIIPIRVLCDYGFGLDLFDGVSTLEEARSKTDALVTKLKDHSLLLDAYGLYGNECVKLHDVIRDVVIFVASKLDDRHRMHNIRNADELEKYFNKEMFKDSTAISLYDIKADHYPQTLKGPKLNLLRLVRSYDRSRLVRSYDEEYSWELSHQFFEGLNKLLVLDCESTSLKPLPASSSFCLLPNLQTLRLTGGGCSLGDISWIGELKSLKILDLSSNDSITELPRGIGKLNRLLSLNLKRCRNLKVIKPNVISSLTRLEELNLQDSFRNWEVEGVANVGDERRNANLSEVKELRCLIDLKLEVADINSLSKDIFSENLEKYCIKIGHYSGDYDEKNTSRTLKLELCPNSALNEHDFAAFLGRSDILCLSGLKISKSVAFEIDRRGFQRLKYLKVEQSTEIRCIVNWNNGNMDCPPAAFPSLESLVLENLINLENIIHEKLTTETPFGQLRDIKVSNCDKLKSLFSLFNNLKQLERIEVEDCKMMEEIISHDGDHVEEIEISQLQSLKLSGLPKLVQFIATSKSDEIKREGRQSIDAPLFNGQVVFPNLDILHLELLNIQKIWNDDQLTSSRFGFQNLTQIKVGRCDHLKGLIPSCMTASLVHLRNLNVSRCMAMKEIVFIEESAQAMEICVSFPKLKSLRLSDLPILERFCGGDFSSPQLEYLELDGLPNLERFCGGDFSSPQLQSLGLFELPNLERFCGGNCVDCPSLSKLTISDCKKFKVFITNTIPMTTREKEDKDSTGSVADEQHLFHHKVVFPNLDILHLELLNIQKIWNDDQLTSSRFGFQNLTQIKVGRCDHLKGLIPSCMTASLVHLRNLNVSRCMAMKEIVFIEESAQAMEICVSFPNIKSLRLSDLPILERFCGGDFSSPQLESLELDGLPNLERFCGGDFSSPQLQSLGLFELPNLERFCGGNCVDCPSLSKLTISDCKKFKVFITNTIPMTTREKEDKDSTGSVADEQHLFHHKAVFPNLDILHLELLNIQKIWNDDQLTSSRFGFQNLTQIKVGRCDHLKGLIPSCMTASLVHLRNLNVSQCMAMKEIVFIEESAQAMEICVSFPKLESLQLSDLPVLERFCGGDFSSPQLESLQLNWLPNLERFCGGDCVDCPSLSRLAISNCKKLKVFITNTIPTTTTEKEDKTSTGSVADKQHLSHHKDVVKVDQLSTECSPSVEYRFSLGSAEEHDKYLVFKTKCLSELILEKQQLPKTFSTVKLLSICEWGIRLKDLATPFQNLKILMVVDCHGLTSLFSPSTAKSLSQRLTQLTVYACKSLRQVIANDDDDDDINIIFSQLEGLLLYDLSNLTSFYSGNNNVVLQFPRLAQLYVTCCPEMKTFSPGNIHCPSLHSIFLEWPQLRNRYWKGDINTTIQKLWEEKNIRDSPETEESVENVDNAEEDEAVGP